jgi:hypothetical protein
LPSIAALLLAIASLALWLQTPRASEAAAAPTLTSVAPLLGSRGGGTAITLTGTGFVAGATVTVGGAPAAGVVVGSATSITATTPAGTPGAAVIVVTNPDTQSATLSGAFTYQEWPPTVGGVAPASGTSLGGTTVTITGTNFIAGARASFGGTQATSTTVTNATTITAVTPAHTAGVVDVVVTNPDNQFGTLAASYTYNAAAAPTVTSTSPNTGTTGGGTPVTITGTNFASGATVTFGGTAAASVQFVSATQITVTTPAKSAGAVAVVVTNPDTQTGTLASGYTYAVTPAPAVTAVSPAQGPFTGGSVTITGTGFLAGATVKFGTAAATGVVVGSATQITATAPANSTAGAVAVEVKNTDNQIGTLASGYTYVDRPTVTSVTPATGPAAGGTAVKIAGSNWGTAPTVKFGSQTATSVVVTSATEISAVTPAGTGAVTVTVTGPGGDGTKASAFTYTGAPALTSATPLEGPASGGTQVTVSGSGLTSGATVLFGDTPGTAVTVASNGNSLTVTSPARAAGNATISVKLTDNQTATLATPFVYTASAGQIVSGTISAGSIALVVFSGGTTDQLVTAATGTSACPSRDRLVVFALVQATWIAFIPAAPAQVNAAWNQRFTSGLPPSSALFVRCT